VKLKQIAIHANIHQSTQRSCLYLQNTQAVHELFIELLFSSGPTDSYISVTCICCFKQQIKL